MESCAEVQSLRYTLLPCSCLFVLNHPHHRHHHSAQVKSSLLLLPTSTLITMTRDPNERDIRIYFDALDQRKQGSLTFDEFYTLYLGLGYPRMDAKVLHSKLGVPAQGEEEGVTLSMALDYLSKVSDVSYEKRYNTILTYHIWLTLLFFHFHQIPRSQDPSSFVHLLDRQGKGKINSADVQSLSKDIGEPISIEEAEAMMEVTFGKNQVSEGQFKTFLASPH